MSYDPNDLSRYADDHEWDDQGTYTSVISEKNLMRGPNGFVGHLAFDDRRVRDAEVCNVSRISGDVCRLPAGHACLHIPFSGELIAVTGIWIESYSTDAE